MSSMLTTLAIVTTGKFEFVEVDGGHLFIHHFNDFSRMLAIRGKFM